MHTILNICGIFQVALSLVLFVAAACSEGLAGEWSVQPKLKSIAFEGGTVYEVRNESTAKPMPELFRFHQNGKFDVMSAGGVYLLDKAQWKRDGSNFQITAETNEEWSAEGRFTEKGIEGAACTRGSTRNFVGHRVDFESYEFSLQEGEVIVLLRMKKYHSWPLPKGKELPSAGAQQDELPEPFDVYGFEFEVLAPRELKGILVTSHHDGDLGSGPAAAIARPGKTYLWRTQRTNIGGREFGICSIDLHWMKDTDDRSADPRYRPGMQLLETLRPAAKNERPGAEPGGATNAAPPHR